MSKRPHMKTTHKQIVDWAMENINSKDSMFGEEWSDTLQKYVKWGEVGYGVDASEMDTHCWRCGHKTPDVQRCHVIPYSLGGKDEASNYRLFCYSCHVEQPNVKDYEATDKWVRETNVGTYNTFWKVREIHSSLYNEVTNHWGESLNDATKKWMAEEFIKRVKKKFGYIDERMTRCLITT